MSDQENLDICSCEQQGHFVSINDKIVRVPEGYVVMFETSNYMGSDLKPGDMAYSKKNNRFISINDLDKYPDAVGSRTCVIRRYIPEEVKRLVDVAQRHAASKADDTIVEVKINIDEPKALPDELLKEDVLCQNSLCDDYGDLQGNNCERVFDITRCSRARYSYNGNDIKPDFDDNPDSMADIDEY